MISKLCWMSENPNMIIISFLPIGNVKVWSPSRFNVEIRSSDYKLQIQNSNSVYDRLLEEDTYRSTKSNNEPILRQTCSLEVTSILTSKDIENTTWKTHQYFSDFESQIVIKVTTFNQNHHLNVDFLFIIDVLRLKLSHSIITL